MAARVHVLDLGQQEGSPEEGIETRSAYRHPCSAVVSKEGSPEEGIETVSSLCNGVMLISQQEGSPEEGIETSAMSVTVSTGAGSAGRKPRGGH